MLCLPSHCSHELQPLDISFFKSLKSGWDDATDSFRRMYPGTPLNKQQFPRLFSRAWFKAATPQNAVSGFKASGIYPFNPDVFPETAFAPSSVSERQAVNPKHLHGNNGSPYVSALNSAVTGDGDDSTTAPRNLLPAFRTSDHNKEREEILLSPKHCSSSEKSVAKILSTPKIQRKNLVKKSLNSKSVVLKRDFTSAVRSN